MVLEDRWLRETYVDLLIEYAAKNKDIVILEADLMKAGGTFRFAEKYPERTFDVGIQEANMIGTAAGMSAMGKIPFTHTFTAFATRRVCDQVTLSVAYAGLNVKMMGSDPGVTAEYNGGTHMSMEDVSIMRNIPGMIVYEPVDSAQLKAIFPQIVDHYGPVYIFATGIMVADAVEAVEELEKEGIHAELINIHTVKPLDEEMVLASVAKTGCAVTAENHSVIGGLGSAVAELLVEKDPVPVKKVGVMDHFGEVGLTPYLKEKYGLTAKDIIAAAKAAIAMKKR